MATLLRFILACTFFVLTILLSVPAKIHAQDQESGDLYENLQDQFKTEYLSISTLLQAQGAFYPDSDGPTSTYRIGTARLGISGNMDKNISYKLLADLSREPSLLDMSASFDLSDQISVTAGAQKPGVSAGFLVAASRTDFISRPLISTVLAGNRDIGVLFAADLSEEFTLSAGMFNGTNQDMTNNNKQFYYTGRLLWSGTVLNGDLQVAVNGSYGNEDGTDIGNGRLLPINGDRYLAGGDFRFTNDDVLLSGEYLYSDLDYMGGLSDRVQGFHLTVGYTIRPDVQLLLRYDLTRSDINVIEDDIVTAGINYQFTEVASFTANYRVDIENASANGLLLQTQIAF